MGINLSTMIIFIEGLVGLCRLVFGKVGFNLDFGARWNRLLGLCKDTLFNGEA